jgi:hypothetical protein
MIPDRSNYEIWFTEWLDGNLNEKQVEEFMIFLKENPDLSEELHGLASVSLEPPEIKFDGKKNLKKSQTDLSDSQFEHLCISSLENDLTPLQKVELIEIIDQDINRRKEFELIQKLKLKPLAGSFIRKSSVKKLTAGQKVIRLSVIGLSAAATISLLIIAFLSLPVTVKKETRRTAQNTRQDTILIEMKQADSGEESVVYAVQDNSISTGKKNISETGVRQIPVSYAELKNQVMPDTLHESMPDIQRSEAISMLSVAIPENILTAYLPSANVLQVWNPGFIPPLIDERSNVDRFLARFFHEKIMKDKKSGTRPVESYEIVQAGIKGLNKLFGWEIALHRNTDGNGNVRSYNFSSKLLKFNAPVKKSVKEL